MCTKSYLRYSLGNLTGYVLFALIVLNLKPPALKQKFQDVIPLRMRFRSSLPFRIKSMWISLALPLWRKLMPMKNILRVYNMPSSMK